MPRWYVSNFLLISLTTQASRSGSSHSHIWLSVLAMRCGDSYKTTVRFSCANACMRVWRPFLWGKNPSKTNLSQGNPDATNAGTKAVGPGKHSTSIPACTQARTNKNPGSEMPGVPASETNTQNSCCWMSSMVLSRKRCSLWAWKANTFFLISK